METIKTRCCCLRIVIFFVFISFFGQTCSAEVDINQYDYSADILEASVKTRAHFVLWYTKTEHCQGCELARTLVHELMTEYNTAEEPPVTVAELDCSQNTELCAKFEVESFPQFHFFPAGEGGGKVKYIGNVLKEDIVQFITDQSSSGDAVVSTNGVYELTKDSFKSFVGEGNHFIKFYAPWCGHCKKLAPTWDDLAKDTESQDIKISKIDCTSHQEICKEHGIKGYPTLKFFGSGEEVESYSGARSLGALKEFVTKQVEKRNAPPAAEEEEEPVEDENLVVELTDKDFADVISSGNTFIKFYAPWCGHCKRLAPTWEELAKFASEMEDVTIAKVDCTLYKEICTENGVKGYPTLYLFQDGERQEKYGRGRDLDSLKAYLTGQFKKDEL